MKYSLILFIILLAGCSSDGEQSATPPVVQLQGAKILATITHPDLVPPTGKPTYNVTVRGKNIGDAPSIVFSLTLTDLGTGGTWTVGGDNLDPGKEQTLSIPLWNTGGNTGVHNFKARIMDGQAWTFAVDFTKSWGG